MRRRLIIFAATVNLVSNASQRLDFLHQRVVWEVDRELQQVEHQAGVGGPLVGPTRAPPEERSGQGISKSVLKQPMGLQNKGYHVGRAASGVVDLDA
jgi:hypothetical protein